jgi:hypothetical protein
VSDPVEEARLPAISGTFLSCLMVLDFRLRFLVTGSPEAESEELGEGEEERGPVESSFSSDTEPLCLGEAVPVSTSSLSCSLIEFV